MHRPVYTLIRKSFGGTHANWKEKNSPQRRIEPTMLHQGRQLAQHTTTELFRLLPLPVNPVRINSLVKHAASKAYVSRVICMIEGMSHNNPLSIGTCFKFIKY